MAEIKQQDAQSKAPAAEAVKLRLNKETIDDLDAGATGDVKGGGGKTNYCNSGSLAP